MRIGSFSGIKSSLSSARLGDLGRAFGDEFVHRRALASGGPEHTAHALDMLAYAERSGQYDGDVRVRHIDAFVQDLCGHECSKNAAAESLEDVLAFLSPDVARHRHDEV